MADPQLRGRDVSIPLLSTGDRHNTANENQEDWTHSSIHGKYSKWIAFPYKQTIYGLLAVIAVIVLGLSTWGSVVGFNAYRKLVFPHRAVHASSATARDGSRVVTPYFAPSSKSKGGEGVSSGTLQIRIWFREPLGETAMPVNYTQTEDYWSNEQQYQSASSIGETGYVSSDLQEEDKNQSDWIEAFSTEVDIMDIERTHNRVARVTLPGQIIHSLVTKSRASLVATFELLPYSPAPSSMTYEHKSTRPLKMYGPTKPWPLPYSPPAPISPEALNSFLAHSSVGRSLKTRQSDWRDVRQQAVELGRYEDTRQEERFATFLSTRTWVTMASEYSVYGVDEYTKAQDALQHFKASQLSSMIWIQLMGKEECANSANRWYYDPNDNDCYRAFERDGHFENLLIADKPTGNGGKEWKYGPFLTTRLSPTLPDDFLELPSEAEMRDVQPSDVKEFSFDWKIMYSAMSPAKLRLAQSTYNSLAIYAKMYGDSYTAKSQDEEEFYKGLLGLSLNPGRPVSRGLAQYISQGLRYLTIPLILHYWYTRRTSTGISLIPLLLQSIIDMIYYIVSSAVDMYRVYIIIFILSIICFVGIILKQLHLLFRPDFKFQNHSESGMKYPSAVRFRLATVEEEKSRKLDAMFDYRLRILMTIVTFCVLRFAPSPPAIVSARKYEDIMQGFGGFQHYSPGVLTAIHILAAIQHSIWLTSTISQIVLNYRNKSFAGLYALTAYLQFGSLILSQITRLFVGWFGKSQIMQPFTIWDIVMMVITSVVVFQAGTFSRVEQVVEETLD